MKKIFLISILLFGYTIQGIAQDNASKKKIVKTSFWVNGNCEMCQARIQKEALKTKGVKMANWQIESKMLSVVYNQTKCSVNDIKQSVVDVGHDSKGYTATDEAYKNLHVCCKYDRRNKPD